MDSYSAPNSSAMTEPGPTESAFDSKQLNVTSQSSGSSSAVRKPTAEGSIRRKKISLRQRAAILLQPPKKVGPAPTVWKSIRAIILASYLNVLLLCIPIAWALNFALPNEHTPIFVFSFLAIIPLAKLRTFATDELSMRVGQTLAGLLNATFVNAVALIFSIIALIKCEIDIVQASLVGSILSNLLLVLGMCFFAGGLKFSEQGFGVLSAQMNVSLLTISVIAVLLPGAFVLSLGNSADHVTTDLSVLKMSHGVAIILFFIYASYLIFQLSSHKALYQDDSNDIMQPKMYTENPFEFKKFRRGKQATVPRDRTVGADDPEAGQAVAPMLLDEDTQEPQMSVPVTFGLLVAVTVLITVTAKLLVDSINGLTGSGHISKGFVGIILLPIIGNAAEHATAVTVSVKTSLTLGAVDSSIQVALFVIPFIVTLGWILGKPLTLLFDPLQSIVLFLSVLTVNYTLQDGKSNWLRGMILMCLYLIVCVTFWFYPGTSPPLTC